MAGAEAEQDAPRWGLGFQVYGPGRLAAFGHAGVGGSIGLADPAAGIAVAVTVNKLSGDLSATRALLRLVAEETGLDAGRMASQQDA